MSKTALVQWGKFLYRPHTFLAVAAAVGSTPVPHQRKKCFLSEGVYPKKVTKMYRCGLLKGRWHVLKTSTHARGRLKHGIAIRLFFLFSIVGCGADVSSVSPLSERMRGLWVTYNLYGKVWRFAIGGTIAVGH